jgi:hypothetical protein
MRLTLRTLLAHLDGVLDPRDAAILKDKIKGSQLASSLIQRIETGLSQPHLSAPAVDGRGLASDPNSIAEYLDNTLPVDRLPELEKICVESDMQLIEVAACHQILSQAVSQIPEVPPPLKARLYQLRVKEEPAEPKAVATDRAKPVGRNIGGDRVARQPETIRRPGLDLADSNLAERVPEYLRGRKHSSWRQAFFTGTLIALAIIVAWQAIGSLDRVRQLLGPTASTEVAVATNPKVDRGVLPTPSADVDIRKIPGPSRSEKSTQGNIPPVEPPSEVEPPSQVETEEPGLAVPKSDATPTPVRPSADQDRLSPEGGTTASWLPETRESTRVLLFTERASEAAAPGADSLAQAKPGQTFSARDRIIAPPFSRTELQWGNGLRWIVASATVMQPGDSNDPTNPNVRAWLGKAVLQATPQCQNIEIQFHDLAVDLRFLSPHGTAAVELAYYLPPGLHMWDGDAVAIPVFQAISLDGDLRLELQAGNQPPSTITLKLGQLVKWSRGLGARPSELRSMDQLPWWVLKSTQREIDAMAASDLHRMLDGTLSQDLPSKLRSMAASRRPELSALASRLEFLLGNYTALNGSTPTGTSPPESEGILNNANLKAHWQGIVDDLRQSLGLSSHHRARLQDTLAQLGPERAQAFTELLMGYTQSQLEQGKDARLVEAMAGPLLERRVLAAHQWQAILGTDSNYLPARPSPESLQLIRRQWNQGKIRYAQEPSP